MIPIYNFLRGPEIVRLQKSFGLTTIAAIANRAIGMLLGILLARYLGSSNYGMFAILLNTAGLFALLAGSGMATAATVEVSGRKKLHPDRAWYAARVTMEVAIIGGLIGALVMGLLAPWVAQTVGLSANEAPLVIASVLFVATIPLQDVILGIFAGYERFGDRSLQLLIQSICQAIGGVFGALLGGLPYAVLGYGVGVSVSCLIGVLHLAMVNPGLTLWQRTDIRKEKELFLHRAFPALAASLITAPIAWLINLIIIRQAGGFEELAVYNVSMQWQVAILFIPLTIAPVLVPFVSRQSKTGHYKDAIHSIWFMAVINLLGTLLFTIPLILLAGPILNAYKFSSQEGVIVFRLLCLGASLNALNQLFGQAIIGLGKLWLGLLVNSIWAIVILSMTWLVSPWGLIAVAAASLASYVIHSIIQGGIVLLWMRDRKANVVIGYDETIN